MRIKFKKGRLGAWSDWYNVRPSAYYGDNYNETLGLSKIHVDHLESEIDIQPFDVVKVELYGSVEVYSVINNITTDQISFKPDIFNYSIELIEPTKLLENYLISPFSVTKNNSQPRTILYYAQKYLDLAFFNERAINGNGTLPFVIDSSITDVIKNTQISEAQVNNDLTLKECLTNLFMQVDHLPYVVSFNESTNQWIIGSRSINTTGSEVTDKHNINYISKSHNAIDYVSDLKIDMKNATQSENITPIIGFRNSERYLMSTDDLEIETVYPIWDLKKFYICVYVKKLGYKMQLTVFGPSGPVISYTTRTFDVNQFYLFDITQFVSEYGLWLCKNVKYDGFGEKSVLDAQYRNSSLYFKRGSKGIHNFQGYRQGASLFIQNHGKWVWEMVLNYFNNADTSYWKDNVGNMSPEVRARYEQFEIDLRKEEEAYARVGSVFARCGTLSPYDENDYDKRSNFTWKDVSFIVDYIPLYNSVILASKSPIARNVKQVIDNQTTELVNAEKLTLLEYMKANRLGNKLKIINARYEAADYGLIPQLSQTVYGSVIFKREFTIYQDYIEANFYATDNYVLRDYYTGVASRLRTWRTTIGEDLEKNVVIKYFGNNRLGDYNQNDQLGNYALIPAHYSNIDELYNKLTNKVCIVKTDVTNNVYGGNAYFYCEHTITKTSKTLVISFKFKDNATLGKYISNPNETGGEGQKDYRYVDDYGECNYIRVIMGKRKDIASKGDVEVAMRDYPKVDLGNIENIVMDITIPYQKDNKEVLQINIQFEYNEEANNIVLVK